MKQLILANLFFSVLCFAAIYETTWFPTLLLLSFYFFSLFLNLCLVPGGFAWRNHNYFRNLKNLRGPISWPFLGFLPQMGHHFHQKLASIATSLDANRLMAISLGTTRVIISSHPDTAKEILSGNSFSDRPIKESARLLMFERAIGFAPSGNYWRHLRRIAANHMFSPRRILCLEGIRQRVANEMIEGICKEMKMRGFV